MGYPTVMYDFLTETPSLSELEKLCQTQEVLMVTFNFIGLVGTDEFSRNGKRIWDTYDVTCINIMVDHPFYYHKHLKERTRKYIQLCVDQLHVDYMHRFFGEIPTGFLPLGGTRLHPEKDLVPYKERPMDVIFTGNYTPPSTFEKYITRIDDEYTQFYYGIIDDLIAHPATPIEVAVEEHVRREMPDVSLDDLKSIMENMTFIDLYVRFHFRGEVVRRVAEAGIPIHLFGSGWHTLSCNAIDQMVVHGPTDSAGCLDAMAQAKIALNVMPWFKAGAHDRIFNAMLQGAISMTDGSNYIEQNLVVNEEFLLYNLSYMDEAPQILHEILSDPGRGERISEAGRSKAGKSHSFQSRANTIFTLWKDLK